MKVLTAIVSQSHVFIPAAIPPRTLRSIRISHIILTYHIGLHSLIATMLTILLTTLYTRCVAALDSSDLKAFKAFRALRALKPLRVVGRHEGMKTVVTSMIQAMPAIANVCVVTILFFVIFGCLGMQVSWGQGGKGSNWYSEWPGCMCRANRV